MNWLLEHLLQNGYIKDPHTCGTINCVVKNNTLVSQIYRIYKREKFQFISENYFCIQLFAIVIRYDFTLNQFKYLYNIFPKNDLYNLNSDLIIYNRPDLIDFYLEIGNFIQPNLFLVSLAIRYNSVEILRKIRFRIADIVSADWSKLSLDMLKLFHQYYGINIELINTKQISESAHLLEYYYKMGLRKLEYSIIDAICNKCNLRLLHIFNLEKSDIQIIFDRLSHYKRYNDMKYIYDYYRLTKEDILDTLTTSINNLDDELIIVLATHYNFNKDDLNNIHLELAMHKADLFRIFYLWYNLRDIPQVNLEARSRDDKKLINILETLYGYK